MLNAGCNPYLVAGLRYGNVKVWATSDWREQRTLPGQGDLCVVAFASDGAQFAASEGDWNRGGVVRVYDVITASATSTNAASL